MIFVGRESETSRIVKQLEQGNNIILIGIYGIGRTSLVQHIASAFLSKWRFIFVDFSQTPGKMSEKLMKELGIVKANKQTGKKWGYKSRRYRIANLESRKGIKTVIVLDDIAKITAQKMIFLRHLILERHFQFIAIAEHFLPEHDLFLLKAQLIPAATVCLRNLNTRDVLDFLRLYSDKYYLNWPDRHIRSLASLVGKYPLGMVEMLKGKREGGNRHEKEN
jgi:hypothetical protein